MNIISELKKQKLTGKSGSCFLTGLKWEIARNAKSKKKYIICNGSEGEPGAKKDEFILKNYPEQVIEGIKIALQTIDNSSAFIYLRKDYYKKFKPRMEKLIGNFPISFFMKTGGYLAGEETCVCQAIEGKRVEPRIKPPFPAEKGLWDCPTLINNVETFYCVAKIAKAKYKKTRFYTIGGDTKNPGVYEFSENYLIKKILEKTNNLPEFDFFVQAGGGAIGEILLANEINKKVAGTGTIIIFDKNKTDIFSLLKKWVDFFLAENCDKCAPCREGVYRIGEMIDKKQIDKKTLDDIFFVLSKTSFCALGRGLVIPFKSLIDKLL